MAIFSRNISLINRTSLWDDTKMCAIYCHCVLSKKCHFCPVSGKQKKKETDPSAIYERSSAASALCREENVLVWLISEQKEILKCAALNGREEEELLWRFLPFSHSGGGGGKRGKNLWKLCDGERSEMRWCDFLLEPLTMFSIIKH